LQDRALHWGRQFGVSNGVVENDRVTLSELAGSTASASDVLEKQTFHGTTLIAVEREPIGENCYAKRKVYTLCKCGRRSNDLQFSGLHCPFDALSNIMGKARIVICDAALQCLVKWTEIRIFLTD
jgi:hypothetical protein